MPRSLCGSRSGLEAQNSCGRQRSYENEIQESSPEVRKVTANATVIEEHKGMLSRFERFSNWQGLKTAVTLCMEYKRRLRMNINTADRNLPVDEGPQINGRSGKAEGFPATRTMVQDLEQAEVEILKLIQTSAFDKEVQTLKEFQAQTEDVYCKRRWRRVQHIANEFWSRWSKEYSLSLQARQNWTRHRRNYNEGDIVLLKDDDTCRNKWPMARVIAARRDDQGQVRSVTVQSVTGSVLNKLVLLLESPEDRPGIPARSQRIISESET